MSRKAVTVLFAAVIAVSIQAQDREPTDRRPAGVTSREETPAEKPWEFWLSGNVQNYGNFFQATEGGLEEDATAVEGEVGASLRLGQGPLRAYGSFNHLNYRDFGLEASNGVRIGLKSGGRPHGFDVYADQTNNRPTFDAGDEFDTADIRTLAGEYTYRFADDWQVSADGQFQQQENEITSSHDNDFKALGAAVRWRGSRLFSPEIGYRAGERDVDDATLSYDQNEWYVQVRSSLTPTVYLSVRYRDRGRQYSTGDAGSSNFGREDARRQLAASADWTFLPMLTLNVYAAREDVDVNRAGRDFDTSLGLVGLTWRF
jgi:hypothetical protein